MQSKERLLNTRYSERGTIAMRFAVPMSFVRRCGVAAGDWRTRHCFFAPSVVDEGTGRESERERERGEREAPEGRCTSNQAATRPQGSMTPSTRTTRRWGTERRRKRAGTPPLWRSRYGRTDPRVRDDALRLSWRLTCDPSHHLPSPYYFFPFLFFFLSRFGKVSSGRFSASSPSSCS